MLQYLSQMCFFIEINMKMKSRSKLHPSGNELGACKQIQKERKKEQNPFPMTIKLYLVFGIWHSTFEAVSSLRLWSAVIVLLLSITMWFLHQCQVEQPVGCMKCWWSLWMLFVFYEFAWKREVSAIINPAKIGIILKLHMLPECNQIDRDRSWNILHWFWVF